VTFNNQFGVVHVASQIATRWLGLRSSEQRDHVRRDANVASRTDFNGSKSCYANDLTRNLETARVEGLAAATACPADASTYVPAANTPQRKILTQWHPDWRLEVRRAEPKKITTSVYNGQPDPTAGGVVVSCAPSTALVDGKPIAVLCKLVEQATSDASGAQGFAATVVGSPRVWTYSYNGYGQTLTSTGPRGNLLTTDPNYAPDTTTTTYYAATDTASSPPITGWGIGRVCGMALGHVTQYPSMTAMDDFCRASMPMGADRPTRTAAGWLTG